MRILNLAPKAIWWLFPDPSRGKYYCQYPISRIKSNTKIPIGQWETLSPIPKLLGMAVRQASDVGETPATVIAWDDSVSSDAWMLLDLGVSDP